MERSDAELLAATRRGEREAFGALIERYQGVVCAVTYSRTGDRALSEDVAQDTFLAAWHQLDRLREVGKLRGWLCAIARNLARKARRRAGRSEPFDRVLVFEGANPFDAACAAESERVVRDALARVPETYRDALVLYYREQRSARDVARALGITEAAALQRLARGRQYLADGVTDLVEQSLQRSARPGRLLAAGVLAALPVVAPSHVAHATSHPGHPMITKLVIAAAALAATGTTAYVIHSHGAAPPAVAAPAPTRVAAAAPAARQHVLAHHVAAPAPAVRAPAPTEADPMPAGAVAVPEPEQLPILNKSIQSRLAHGPSIGPANAPVTIAVFTDLKCPFCGKAVGALDQLIDEFPSKIRVVMRQMPVHDTAILAAEGTFAADAQGKFWEYYDQVFAHEGAELTRDQLVAYATDAGLDATAFAAALDNHTYAPALQAERDLASELELTGTPTFVINGQRVVGMRSIEDLRGYINAALAAAPQ